MLLEAIAEHCREGLRGLFLKGYTTGAISVGYRAKEVPDAPRTKRDRPRTIPEVDPEVAQLIQRHALLHLAGMGLKEGRRRWLAAGGPCDPRSTTGRMSPEAYRRLWSRERLTGRWKFGQKRNQFSTSLDYVQQVNQPDAEVATFHCEELRILSDEVFNQLQVWLNSKGKGPREPRKKRPLQLWDLTTEMFFCAACSENQKRVRFYQTGANGHGMQCKNADLCPCKSAVRRQEAVRAVCCKLAELVRKNVGLIEAVVSRSPEIDSHHDDHLGQELLSQESRVRTLANRVEDLHLLLGQGSADERQRTLARIRDAQQEVASARVELDRLRQMVNRLTTTISPEVARQTIVDSESLLLDAAAGKLGEDAMYKALSIFRRLTGGQILVHVEKRPGRKRTNVRGVFEPQLSGALGEQYEHLNCKLLPPVSQIVVWLREPPLLDKLAERVHLLIDVDGLSYGDVVALLRAEGIPINFANVWYSYRRWYEMQGLPVPKRPYNNGRRRHSA
jgi:site-specific DNA recombinase